MGRDLHVQRADRHTFALQNRADLPVLPGCGQIEVANFEGRKKVFYRANVARGAAVVSASLHPCRFQSRS